MTDTMQPEYVTNQIMYVLTTQQIRALACQNKLENWKTESMGTLKRNLLRLSQTQDILGGEQA